MATNQPPALSGFSETLPEEPGTAAARPAEDESFPAYDPQTSMIDVLSAPFCVEADNQTAKEAVRKAIEDVIMGKLRALFPDVMDQLTSVGARMLADDVFSWVCPGGGDFQIQCTPDSKTRSGYRKLPALYSGQPPYASEKDVQRNKDNRQFFKRMNAFSKATLWWALTETGNSSDPFVKPPSLDSSDLPSLSSLSSAFFPSMPSNAVAAWPDSIETICIPSNRPRCVITNSSMSL